MLSFALLIVSKWRSIFLVEINKQLMMNNPHLAGSLLGEKDIGALQLFFDTKIEEHAKATGRSSSELINEWFRGGETREFRNQAWAVGQIIKLQNIRMKQDSEFSEFDPKRRRTEGQGASSSTSRQVPRPPS